MTPIVSIIIPTYNYGNFIDSAIRSALAQQEYPCEVIVVDDGSIDNTVEVIQPYLESIRYIRQDNAGLSAARNTGIKASRGSYLQFLDADDLLGKGVVAAKVTIMEKYSSIGLVVCRNQFFCTEPVQWWSSLFCGAWRLYPENLDVHLCFSNIAPPHAYLIRRDLALSIGEFDTGLLACEDYDYWLRAAFSGYAPIFSPNGKVYYRRHATSMSADHIRQVQWDVIMHFRLYNLINEYPNFPESGRLLGLIAFLAGTLKTINRLCRYSIPVPHDLYKICEETGKEIISESKKKYCTHKNFVLYFYLILIEIYLGFLENKKISFVKNMRFFILNTLKNLGLPTKKYFIAWESLKIGFLSTNVSYIQRYKLIKAVIRYLI